MTITTKLSFLLAFARKHIILSIVALILILTSLSIAAFQVLAPKEYKSTAQTTNSASSFSSVQNSSSTKDLVDQSGLETALLEKCGLEIKYNPDKYYVVEPSFRIKHTDKYIESLDKRNLSNIEIREKKLADGNEAVVEYECNSDSYKLTKISEQTEKLFPSSNYKIPLFNNSFWDKTVEAGRIEFSGNVENNEPEEFPSDWTLVKNDANFEARIKTQNAQKTVFHQLIFRRDPISFDGKDLQLGLIDSNSRATKTILTDDEFEKLQAEEIDKNAKKINKFQNWDRIKFAGKVNKISDIPEDLIKEYGVPQFGFRFYKGVAFWSGYLRGGNLSTKENYKDGDLIAFDGQNIVGLKSENGSCYLSSLIKDGIGYNFGCGGAGWGMGIADGFFIDFDKGEYWISKEGVDKENYNQPKIAKELIQPYLDEDFPIWKDLGRPKIYTGTGYQTYKDGKIYGRFQKYTGQIKDNQPESAGFFVLESDGQSYKFLYEAQNNCSTPVDPCSDSMNFNSRGNLVYHGTWIDQDYDQNKPETNTIKITEQDFETGKILREEIGIDTPELRQKYGI